VSEILKQKLMKTLELNAYDVQEMSSMEMNETDGGFAWVVALAVVVGLYYATEIAGNPVASGKAFAAGWNSVN